MQGDNECAYLQFVFSFTRFVLDPELLCVPTVPDKSIACWISALHDRTGEPEGPYNPQQSAVWEILTGSTAYLIVTTSASALTY